MPSREQLGDLRSELRTWIAECAPAGLRDAAPWYERAAIGAASNDPHLHAAYAGAEYQLWEERLLDAHLICPQWPTEYGGRGWSDSELLVFAEECLAAGVPRVTRLIGESLVGPSIMKHGSDDQKQRLLPRIIDGTHRYCQGFSEPGAGSDLASLRTRGEVVGDELVINGQKTWTSLFEQANYIFLLCRTGTSAERHHGLTFVVMPFSPQNGITAHPIRQITGTADFCDTFFDDARAPLDDVIGGVGNGWSVAMTTLQEERSGAVILEHLFHRQEFNDLVQLADDHGRQDDPLTRRDLAWAYTHAEILRFHSARVLAAEAAGGDGEPVLSVAKLLWSEYHRKLGEIAFGLGGSDQLVRPAGDTYSTSRWQDMFLATRATTIFSGTSEVQRTIISERVMGMPR